MDETTDLCFMSARALAASIQAGEISPVAVLEAVFRRIEAHDERV